MRHRKPYGEVFFNTVDCAQNKICTNLSFEGKKMNYGCNLMILKSHTFLTPSITALNHEMTIMF